MRKNLTVCVKGREFGYFLTEVEKDFRVIGASKASSSFRITAE